jgi:hypothetical protein
MQVRPHDPAIDGFGCLKEVMMIIPVDPDIDEAQDITQEDGENRLERFEMRLSGTFRSSTMMVMMIAITPSLNASSRLGDTRPYPTINHNRPHLSAVSVRNPREAVNFHCSSSRQTIVCRPRARVLDYHLSEA